MRITELFTAQSIALDEALQTQEEILSRLVELQATHGNITDKEAYKKALYAREAEGSTYVDNGITVPHAKTAVVTRPSLAALRLAKPVQYNAEDDGTTDLLFAIAAPENGSLHVDMLARMMQMLMNEDFVAKLKAAKTPKEFLDCIDAQEEAQFGAESFTQQQLPQNGYRILAVTACVNGIAHTYMAAEALTKAGDKLGLPTKVETNGSDGAKNILTRAEIAACDGIIVAAEKKVDTARFDGKPVLFTRVDDGIHKPEELIKKIAHGEVPVFHAEGGAAAEDDTAGKDSFGRSLYKNLMNGVSHMLPFVVGGGIMIALAFLLDDYSINPANFGMNTPVAARGLIYFERDILAHNVNILNIHALEYTGYVAHICDMKSYFDENLKLIDDRNLEALFPKGSPIYTKIRDDNPTRYVTGSKVVDSILADGCVIEGTVENCVLFRGVKVKKGAVVKNCVLMQDTVVEPNVELDCVVTDKNVKITAGKKLSGTESFPVYVQKNHTV